MKSHEKIVMRTIFQSCSANRKQSPNEVTDAVLKREIWGFEEEEAEANWKSTVTKAKKINF